MGEALFLAHDQFTYATPGISKVLILFMSKNSMEDYRLPSIGLQKSGVRLIVINLNKNVKQRQAQITAGEKYLAFYMSYYNTQRSYTKLIKLLETISGKPNPNYKHPSSLSNNNLAKTWVWNSQQTNTITGSFNPIEASFLIDTITSPDYNAKLGYNIIRLFDQNSRMSIESFGYGGNVAHFLKYMSLYKTQSEKMFAFQSILSNSVNNQISKSSKVLLRKKKIIKSIFKNKFSYNFNRKKIKKA